VVFFTGRDNVAPLARGHVHALDVEISERLRGERSVPVPLLSYFAFSITNFVVSANGSYGDALAIDERRK
jgi:hypothetical protein